MLIVGYCFGIRSERQLCEVEKNTPKNISLTDPAAQWSAAWGPAFYAYSAKYLIDTAAGSVVDAEATPAHKIAMNRHGMSPATLPRPMLISNRARIARRSRCCSLTSSESSSLIDCDCVDRAALTTSFFWRRPRRTYDEWRSGCAR
jgi:hypothetical protein